MTSVISRLRPDETAARTKAVTGETPGIALLPIGADLLPRQTTVGRGGRGTRSAALGIVLLAVVGVVAAFALASHARSSATTSLAAAQDRQQSLRTQQRAFAELVTTQQQAAALGAAVRSVMATDAPWSTLLAAVGTVRGGVTFTAVDANLTDASTSPAGTAAAAPAGAIGTVSITGTAADKPTIATFVDALTRVKGLADPFLSSVSSQQGSAAGPGGYTFTVTAALTDDLTSTAKSRWATTTTGGGK